MKYTNPDLLDQLAAQYVLGTLKGRARARFEAICAERANVRHLVSEWEQRLAPFNDSFEAVAPPVEVLEKIQVRLGHGKGERARKSWWQASMLWKSWGVATTLCSLVLVAVVIFQEPKTIVVNPNGDMVAVVNAAVDQPLWMVKCDMKTGKVMVKAWKKNIPHAEGRYKLWLVSSDGSKKTLALGALPMEGEMEMPMPGEMARWQGNKVMAVSLEPMDAEDAPVAKGPVMYMAPLVAF